MKPTEINPLGGGQNAGRPGGDRFTQFLIWAAFFLVAAIAALAVDLWLRPANPGLMAQAEEPAATTATFTPTTLPQPPTALPHTRMPLPSPEPETPTPIPATETPTLTAEPTTEPTEEPTPLPTTVTATMEAARKNGART